MNVRTEEEREKYRAYMRNYQKAHYTSKATVYQPLSDDEKDYIRIHSIAGTPEKMSAREIAEYIGCSIQTIAYQRKKMGLKIQRNKK